MTSQQSDKAGQEHEAPDLFAPVAVNKDASVMMLDDATPGFGSRLRAAREARGLDLESCGHALRLPVRILRQLESNDYQGIDYQVYLAGYIAKYGRHLGVDEDAIEAEVARIKRSNSTMREPELVATGGISHSRYLFERYATAATYVVLTAVIAVPTIWLGVRGALNSDVSHLAPLDAKPVAQQDAPAPASSVASRIVAATTSAAPGAVAQAQPTAAPSTQAEQPLMASMMPVPNLGADVSSLAKPASSPAPAVASVGSGGHSLQLTLADASWVEVSTADGTRLEYGLLPAGTTKTYHSDQPLEVRIGNAGGAQISVDGQPMPLDSYRHANVAHFRIQMQDGKAVPSGA
jgi:cytoskeleton protein RodZ